MKPFQFIKEVFEQLKHISWPDTKTVFKLTLTVIIVSVIGAGLLGGFDLLFAKGFTLANKSNQTIDANSLLDNMTIEEATPSAQSSPATNSSQITD